MENNWNKTTADCWWQFVVFLFTSGSWNRSRRNLTNRFTCWEAKQKWPQGAACRPFLFNEAHQLFCQNVDESLKPEFLKLLLNDKQFPLKSFSKAAGRDRMTPWWHFVHEGSYSLSIKTFNIEKSLDNILALMKDHGTSWQRKELHRYIQLIQTVCRKPFCRLYLSCVVCFDLSHPVKRHVHVEL